MGTAKLTISIKRRLATGDEIFIAPGMELTGPADDIDATKAKVTEGVNSWLDELLEQYPDIDLDDEDADEEDVDDEDEDEDEDADDADDEDADEEDDDEDEITEAAVKKMKKAELQALADEYELELEGTTVKDMREEILEALFEDDEDEDEDDEDEADEDDEDEDDEDALTEEDLEAMKLSELQELADEHELDHPKLKKGMKVQAKKQAYIDMFLEYMEEE